VNLSNNGGNSETINVTGYVYQTANLTNASATINGGLQTIKLTGSNTLDLQNTAGQTDSVYGSNASVSMTNTYAAVVGSNENVTFASGTNIVSLWNSFSNFDTVNGSNGGTVYLDNSNATVTGSNDTINFDTWNEYANIVGNNDTIGFLGELNNSASVTGTGEHFMFSAAWGQASISGFDASDQFNLSASDFGGNWAGAQSHMAQVGANTVITLDPNNSITLAGVAMNTLQSSQFHFA
jgi:hypothetical protein